MYRQPTANISFSGDLQHFCLLKRNDLKNAGYLFLVARAVK